MQQAIELKTEVKKRSEESSSDRIIPPDNKALFSGSITLTFHKDTGYSEILRLANLLRANSNIEIGSIGGTTGKGSWIQLYFRTHTPLYQIIAGVPTVRQIIRKRNEILIIMSKTKPALSERTRR